MTLQPAIPAFRIFDYALAKAFYCQWLGFSIDWEYHPVPTSPRFLQISRDKALLHLSEHYGDGTPGSKVLIHVDDVKALHTELQSRPNPNMNPSVVDAPWGALIIEVTDPFGNRVCFNQDLTT